MAWDCRIFSQPIFGMKTLPPSILTRWGMRKDGLDFFRDLNFGKRARRSKKFV